MNTHEPETTWKNLLSLSAPTFSAAAEPPYGFVTNTLAVLRAEARQQREFERIGWRAFLASLAALGMAAVVAVTVNLHQQNATDFDPGVRSLVQVDSLPYS